MRRRRTLRKQLATGSPDSPAAIDQIVSGLKGMGDSTKQRTFAMLVMANGPSDPECDAAAAILAQRIYPVVRKCSANGLRAG